MEEPAAMTTREQIRQQAAEIRRIAASHGVVSIRLFGSVARGEERPDSDVDFLVEVGPETSPWFPAGLILDLEDLLDRPVQVVVARALREDLRERVLGEAVRV
jgi:predicted nucleotidyltransferase